MSDPRFPLAPACPDDDSTILEPDLDYYRGCYEDVSRDFWFLLGVIRKARDMVRTRGTTQLKTSELLDVLGRDDKDLLHGQPAEARGAVIMLDFDQARLLWGLCRAWLEGVVYRAGSGPTHELTRERIEAARATLQVALAPSERQP